MERNTTTPRTRQLPAALQLHILSLLPPNERALSGRFVGREAADAFQHCTASLSQPLPPHAVPWAQEAAQQHIIQLPFKHKSQLLCAAATSGSEVNLEVAWAVLQPSFFVEPPEQGYHNCYHGLANPGVAAVEAGHPQLLGWLLRHCPALLRLSGVLQAAGEHCDLAGLQGVCEIVGQAIGNSQVDWGGTWQQTALDAAAKSTVPDAVAKMEWMLQEYAGACSVRQPTIEAVACSGDLARLQWLKNSGSLALHERENPQTRLPDDVVQEARLDMVQWLVDEAGWRLPEDEASGYRVSLLKAAARSADGVAKLRWLQERGAARPQLLRTVAREAARTGQTDVVRYLMSVFGPAVVLEEAPCLFGTEAAGWGSMATMELLQQAGFEFDSEAYQGAACAGSMDMLRWLAVELRVPAGRFTLQEVVGAWPRKTPHDSRRLLEAVTFLLGTVCQEGNARPVRYATTLSAAAARGDPALVRYLQERPPPQQQPQQQQQQQDGQQPEQQLGRWPNSDAVVNIAAGGCGALLNSLAEHPSCLSGPVRASPYVAAGRNGDRATLVALRRLEVPWGAQDVMVKAVEQGCSVAVLRWLAEQGAPVGDRHDMRSAVGRRWSSDCATGAWLLNLADSAARA